ncbi:MAG TPA: glycosyltransferase family 39 protein [Thermoanaerobaculia bacterium]|nr:glycosyltransferase family 39 protein [Thermoanaerobaculia bacterium]
MTRRRWTILLTLLIVLTAARVATTYRVFSQTNDEPFHLAAGYDFLLTGRQTSDPQHPPLARVFFALPFLQRPPPASADGLTRGNMLLLRDDRYTQNLGRARIGNLLFLVIGIAAVALWARHLISPAAGLIAALLFASTPAVLAHAALATTDMAVAAMLPAALYALTRFLDRPSTPRTIVLGVAIALGMLSKYAFIVYFPVAALVLIVVRRRFPLLKLIAAAAIAAFLIWATFRFAFSTLQAADPRAAVMCAEAFHAPRLATALRLPAPDYINGFIEVDLHNRHGHRAFLLGEMKDGRGWWYYFPVAFFFKTPIPLLLLTVAGIAALIARRKFEVPLIALGLLGVAMTSHINIGIRHLLPIYAPLAVAATYTIVELRRVQAVSVALIAWLVIGIGIAHPDYLPWFNAFAGPHPETILNDSNLDWGQDVLRLARTCRTLKINHLTTSLATTADLDRIGLPPHTNLEAMSPVHGYLAISEMMLAQGYASPAVHDWLARLLGDKPYRHVGKSIRLYELR